MSTEGEILDLVLSEVGKTTAELIHDPRVIVATL